MNAGEGIGILDAIDAYTINGARLMQQQDITGSLEAGKKADFIILDRILSPWPKRECRIKSLKRMCWRPGLTVPGYTSRPGSRGHSANRYLRVKLAITASWDLTA